MFSFNLDKVGFCASGLCAVHCVSMPILLLFFGTSVRFSIFNHPLIDIVVLLVAVIVGLASFIPSFLIHKKIYVLVLFFSGIFLVINAEFATVHISELALSIVGGILMAYAHYENFKLKTASR